MGLRRSELAARFDIAIRPVVTCIPVPSGVLGRNLVCHQGPTPVIAPVVLDSIDRRACEVTAIAVAPVAVPLLDGHDECGKVRTEAWCDDLHDRDGNPKDGQGRESTSPSPHVSSIVTRPCKSTKPDALLLHPPVRDLSRCRETRRPCRRASQARTRGRRRGSSQNARGRSTAAAPARSACRVRAGSSRRRCPTHARRRRDSHRPRRHQRRRARSEEHTSELQSQSNLVCRLLLEKKKKKKRQQHRSKLVDKLLVEKNNAKK